MSKIRNDKECIICLMLKPSQVSLSIVYKANKKLQKKNFLSKGWRGELNKKRKKKCFLTALTTMIKKDPTVSIRKFANELTVHKKTVRTAIKQDLSPNLNSP